MLNGLEWARAVTDAKRRKSGLASAQLKGLDGRVAFGAKYGADLFVGRSIAQLHDLIGKVGGLPVGHLGYEVGWYERLKGVVGAEHVKAFALDALARHVGRDRANATFREVEGVYGGAREYTVEIVFIHETGPDGWDTFQGRMLALGEEIAYAFAQESVIVQFTSPDGVDVHATSPIGFPAPGDDLRAYLVRLREGR